MKFLFSPVSARAVGPKKTTRFGCSGKSEQAAIAVGEASRLLMTCCVSGLLFIIGVAHSADAPLTLAEAQRKAVERSRQLSGQDAAVLASREMAVAAGQLPDPVVRFGIDNVPADGPDQFSLTRDFMTMRRVGIMQELTRTEKRQLRAQRFEREADKTLAEKAAAIAQIQRDTALAWIDRYYTESLAAVIAQQASEAKLEIVAAETAYRAGKGSQADILAAHGALAEIEDQASEMASRTRSAKTALARWIGTAADAPLADKPAIGSIRLDPATLDKQLGHHPEIAVYAMQEQVAATEAQLARAEKNADWSVEVNYAFRGSAYSNMVWIGVSIPLQWDQSKRQNRDLASKLALVAQAKARHEEALRVHDNEVRTMLNEWENGRERLTRYERELIPLARERMRATLAAYQGTKATLTELLLARRNEIDMRMKAVALEAEIARLWARLEFLIPDRMIATPADSFVPPVVHAVRAVK
jgi:outer membrane protein TolC